MLFRRIDADMLLLNGRWSMRQENLHTTSCECESQESYDLIWDCGGCCRLATRMWELAFGCIGTKRCLPTAIRSVANTSKWKVGTWWLVPEVTTRFVSLIGNILCDEVMVTFRITIRKTFATVRVHEFESEGVALNERAPEPGDDTHITKVPPTERRLDLSVSCALTVKVYQKARLFRTPCRKHPSVSALSDDIRRDAVLCRRGWIWIPSQSGDHSSKLGYYMHKYGIVIFTDETFALTPDRSDWLREQ